MKLRQQFAAITAIVGLLTAITCGIGYYMAQSMLSESIEDQLTTIVKGEGDNLDSWFVSKAAIADGAAASLSKQSAEVINTQASVAFMTGISADKDILDMTNGLETGKAYSVVSGDISSPDVDPRTRDWYKDIKSAKKGIYTSAYVNKAGSLAGKMVVSYAVPVIDANGNFLGGLCEDIDIDTLAQVVSEINYQDHGTALIVDSKGQIIASSGSEKIMSNVTEDTELAKLEGIVHSQPMGFFETKRNGENALFAYTTLEKSGLIVGLFVPSDYVFAPLSKLKLIYAIIFILGIVITSFGGMAFATKISNTVIRLRDHSLALSEGNLAVTNLEVQDRNEFGELTTSLANHEAKPS